MRVKALTRSERESAKLRGRLPFEYKATAPSNGPPLIHERAVTSRLTDTKRVSYLAVKPYHCVLSDGVYGSEQTSYAEVLYPLLLNEDLYSHLTTHVDPQFAVNRAIESALNFGDILLAVSFAERKQTLQLLRQIFVRLFKFVKEVYLGVKNVSLSRVGEAVSTAWLEYRYGWTPLVLEIKNLYEFATGKSFSGLMKSHGSTVGKVPEFKVENSFLGSSDLKNHDVVIKPKTVGHQAGFNFGNKATGDNESTLRQIGLDAHSMLTTAYELIPFSFVLDMFVNLGDFLNSYDYKSEIEPFNGYLTTFMLADVEFSRRYRTETLDRGVIREYAGMLPEYSHLNVSYNSIVSSIMAPASTEELSERDYHRNYTGVPTGIRMLTYINGLDYLYDNRRAFVYDSIFNEYRVLDLDVVRSFRFPDIILDDSEFELRDIREIGNSSALREAFSGFSNLDIGDLDESHNRRFYLGSNNYCHYEPVIYTFTHEGSLYKELHFVKRAFPHNILDLPGLSTYNIDLAFDVVKAHLAPYIDWDPQSPYYLKYDLSSKDGVNIYSEVFSKLHSSGIIMGHRFLKGHPYGWRYEQLNVLEHSNKNQQAQYFSKPIYRDQKFIEYYQPTYVEPFSVLAQFIWRRPKSDFDYKIVFDDELSVAQITDLVALGNVFMKRFQHSK